MVRFHVCVRQLHYVQRQRHIFNDITFIVCNWVRLLVNMIKIHFDNDITFKDKTLSNSTIDEANSFCIWIPNPFITATTNTNGHGYRTHHTIIMILSGPYCDNYSLKKRRGKYCEHTPKAPMEPHNIKHIEC